MKIVLRPIVPNMAFLWDWVCQFHDHISSRLTLNIAGKLPF
jgi:hypothetical protein